MQTKCATLASYHLAVRQVAYTMIRHLPIPLSRPFSDQIRTHSGDGGGRLGLTVVARFGMVWIGFDWVDVTTRFSGGSNSGGGGGLTG
ncbi:unnamed protein product [Prunus armeniaca]|uniref:Uncharacterized protein n=1 Tax=Prunus armeniaca TaxID=36596 RepID=A0A6J5UD37_PRUAR|nr:unnamed protein product [Prunus armeniaca]